MLNNKYHILSDLFQIQQVSFVKCPILSQVATKVDMSHSRVTCLWFATKRFTLLPNLFNVPSMCKNFNFYLEM